MLSTSFNDIYDQRNLRFPPRLDHWLFQDCYQIAVHNDAGLTVNTNVGFAGDKYCFKLLFSLSTFNFLLLHVSFR